MESARPATEADLDDLVRLWEEALVELDGQRGGRRLASGLAHPDLRRFFRDALDDRRRLVAVGLIDQVAMGVASLRADGPVGDLVGHLELVYVDPNARQVGVGQALLSLVLERCAEWGVSGLDAPALPGSRSAKAFFETQGMQARLLIMHRPIGDSPRA